MASTTTPTTKNTTNNPNVNVINDSSSRTTPTAQGGIAQGGSRQFLQGGAGASTTVWRIGAVGGNANAPRSLGLPLGARTVSNPMGGTMMNSRTSSQQDPSPAIKNYLDLLFRTLYDLYMINTNSLSRGVHFYGLFCEGEVLAPNK